jgi:predicted alpha/beta-fold hydrolase
LRPFQPVVSNPHLLTILGNFWPRRIDLARFPERRRLYATEPGVQVLAIEQSPLCEPVAHLVLLHGLEGSHEAGYMVSMAQAALEAGYRVSRLNMRSCGGTEELAPTLYHAGLTSDLRCVLETVRSESSLPLFATGYSLGANVVLKLAGELGEGGRDLVSGFCAVSAPLDLAECVREISKFSNRLYEQRFVSRLKDRYGRRNQAMPEQFPADGLAAVRTVYEFDDRFTAKAFGFGTADNYYATQSSIGFLNGIRVPTLLIQAKDDPMIPFAVFETDALRRNPCLRLLAVEKGGHIGFIARSGPRFWQDGVILDWLAEQMASSARLV